ncbi:MAG: SWIM zinc finger family protein [Bryobacteraceae bacterium]
MSALAVDQTYWYAEPSSVETASSAAGGSRIRLVTTPQPRQQPFFSGTLSTPRLAADLMLALTQVVQSRFYVPPAMVARILANADPVITFGGGRLRFEGFSACCGVYARIDLLPGSYEADRADPGTTNVDFNPPMRAALSRLRAQDAAKLLVSAGQVEWATSRGCAIERKVKLPVRWLKGFVEIQSHQARMSPQFTLTSVGARRFLNEIPRGAARGPVYALPAGAAVRLSLSPLEGGVRVGGIERLKILEPVIRHAKSLVVHASEDGATGWEVNAAGSRFFLVLSPAASRGFSGEGRALFPLSETPVRNALGAMRAALRWQSVLDAKALAAQEGLDPESITWALAQLGALGLVGYDLAEHAYFHRELPFDLSLVQQLQPRLRDARKLVAEGGVRFDTTGEAWVQGTGVEHRVRQVGDEWRCTCTWTAKHAGERGPCKHILAARIKSGEDDGID